MSITKAAQARILKSKFVQDRLELARDIGHMDGRADGFEDGVKRGVNITKRDFVRAGEKIIGLKLRKVDDSNPDITTISETDFVAATVSAAQKKVKESLKPVLDYASQMMELAIAAIQEKEEHVLFLQKLVQSLVSEISDLQKENEEQQRRFDIINEIASGDAELGPDEEVLPASGEPALSELAQYAATPAEPELGEPWPSPNLAPNYHSRLPQYSTEPNPNS